MEAILLNDNNSEIMNGPEAEAIRAALIFAENVASNITIINVLHFYYGYDTVKESTIFLFYKSFTHNQFEAYNKNIEAMLQLRQFLNARKHKTKDDIITLNRISSEIPRFREYAKSCIEVLLNKFNFVELAPFVADETLYCMSIEANLDMRKEGNPMADYICEMLLVPKGMFIIYSDLYEAEQGVALAEYLHKESDATALSSFFHIPLFAFPNLIMLDHSKLRYTRDRLLKHLNGFNKGLEGLKDELKDVAWTVENFNTISHAVSNATKAFPENMDSIINSELYIQQAMNEAPLEKGIQVGLGISSFDYVLRYFENTKTVTPVMVEIARQRLLKKAGIDNTAVFFYLKTLERVSL